jgi:hypothetical protein
VRPAARSSRGRGPSVGEVDAPLGQELDEPAAHPVGAVLGLPPGLDAGERLEADVEVLDQEPAAGPQRGHNASQGLVPLWNMDQHQAGVHEVEPRPGRLVGGHVVPAHFHVPRQVRAHLADVEVGGHDVAGRADPLGQQARNARATGADLPAPPPGRNPDSVDMPHGHPVEQCGQRVEARPGGGGTVVE